MSEFDSATEPGVPQAQPSVKDPARVESKLVVATTLATLLYAVLEVIQSNTAALAFLPPWAQQVVLAVLPTLLAFAAGWRVPSNRV